MCPYRRAAEFEQVYFLSQEDLVNLGVAPCKECTSCLACTDKFLISCTVQTHVGCCQEDSNVAWKLSTW